MSRGSECPVCAEDIGIWAILKAKLPNRFYCPHCKERVWYRGIGGVIVAFSVLLGLLVGLAVGVAWFAVGLDKPGLALGVAIGVLIVGMVPFELAYALVLRSGGYELDSFNAPKDDWDDF